MSKQPEDATPDDDYMHACHMQYNSNLTQQQASTVYFQPAVEDAELYRPWSQYNWAYKHRNTQLRLSATYIQPPEAPFNLTIRPALAR